jgi:predicted PurR-regulated permease PerM
VLAIDERALRIVWTVFLFGLLLAIVYFIRDTLLLFALAIFFAYMLSPVVTLIQRLVPKRKTLALVVVYVSLVGLLVLAGFEVIPKIASQATTLLTQLPKLVNGNQLSRIPLPAFLEPLREQVLSTVTQEAAALQSRVIPFIQEAGTKILSGLSALLPTILVPILAFFFLKDGESIRVALIGAVEDGRDRTALERTLDDIHLLLQNYIRALVLMAAASFVCWLLFLSVMRYPYELLLAGLAGVLEFIPVVGPATAGVVALLVCGITGSGGILWILIFWGSYRVFADYVLNPYLMSSGVEVHPLLVLFGVLAGESVAGIPGMFFSVPVIAILRVIYQNLRQAHTARKRNRIQSPADLTLKGPLEIQR